MQMWACHLCFRIFKWTLNPLPWTGFQTLHDLFLSRMSSPSLIPIPPALGAPAILIHFELFECTISSLPLPDAPCYTWNTVTSYSTSRRMDKAAWRTVVIRVAWASSSHLDPWEVYQLNISDLIRQLPAKNLVTINQLVWEIEDKGSQGNNPTMIIYLSKERSSDIGNGRWNPGPLTQPQPGHPTEIAPWQSCKRGPVLHLGEIQDDRGERDEDQIEETQRGDKVCRFAKVSTSKEHLEQNLGRERNSLATPLETLLEQKGKFYTVNWPAQGLFPISSYPTISVALNRPLT